MNKIVWSSLALACLVAACVRTHDGTPAPAEGTVTSPPSPTARPTPGWTDPANPGVVPTTRVPLPAAAATCPKMPGSPVSLRAKVTDPAAPIITIEFPAGWSMSTRATGDLGAFLERRNGASARITIARTELGAAEAFGEYVDDVMAASPVTTVDVLPADFCGYSGKKLTGSWSDTPRGTVEFVDRLTHVWTDSGDYLVVIHVQAPFGTRGFDAAAKALMKDFAIVIP